MKEQLLNSHKPFLSIIHFIKFDSMNNQSQSNYSKQYN